MKNKTNIIIFLIFSIFFLNMAFFSPVEARLSLRKFFRSVKRTGHFIVTLPNKSTRWMGPVLGPIAADVLTGGVARNTRLANIFSKASKIDKTLTTIEQQEKFIKETKDAYIRQASDLKSQAQQIRDSRSLLLENLKTGEITYGQYKQHVLDLEEIALIYENTADKFTKQSQKINFANMIKIVGQEAVKQTLKQTENIIVGEINNEIKQFLNLDTIKSLLRQDVNTADNLLNILISSDLTRILKSTPGSENFNIDNLKSKILEQIKQTIAENKKDLKQNWKEKIKEIIEKSMNEMESEKENLPTLQESSQSQQNQDNKKPSEEKSVQCPPGYEFCPHCGVECRQKNCNDITHAHWDYTGHCICGSSGSINENPEDPNKKCSYGPDNKSCPSCVYACVQNDQKCPKPKDFTLEN